MAITFACDQCGQKFSVDGALAGRRVKCKSCGNPLTVPGGAAPRPAASAGRPQAPPPEIDDPYDLNSARPSHPASVGEALLPRGRGVQRPGASAKTSTAPGVPVWVWFAGGAVGLIVVVLAAVAVLSRPRGPEAVAAHAPASGGTEAHPADGGGAPAAEPPPPAEVARFQRDGVSAAAAMNSWRVKADPPREPLVFPPLAKLTIPIPDHFGGDFIIYPTTPSPFVMVGGNENDDHFRDIWDLRTASRVGRLKGKIDVFNPKAFSPDGAYFVTHTLFEPKNFDIWRIEDATRIARIADDGKHLYEYVDFVGPGEGRIILGSNLSKFFQVWDFLEGKPLFKIETNANFKTEGLALSPGRRYLALIVSQKNQLRVYDLSTGKIAGDVEIEKEESSNYDCEGLAFSPDGTALAGLFKLGKDTHLLCWDAANGKLVSDFTAPGHNPFGKSFAYKALALQWLPDQLGWLINDQTFVDRQSGQVVWSEPFPPIKYKEHGPRRVLDYDRMVALGEVGGRHVLRLVPLQKTKILAGLALAKGGKNAVDAILPPITAADLTGAKTVAPAPGPIAWKAVPVAESAPSKATAAGKPIATRITAGDVLSLAVSNPDASQALVVSSPGGRLSDAKGKQSQQPRNVVRFDLAGGRSLDQFEIPSVSTPIAFSPGATHFLLANAVGLDRLDLHAAAGGKHLAGWRPFDAESGDDRIVAWADFLDAKRVLTVSKAGTLVLWSVPECKAVYVSSQAMQGVPALRPDRKSLAVLRNGTLRMLDPETGEPQGDSSGASHPSGAGLSAAGFAPDGQELAAVLDGMIVRWNLKTGEIVGEVPSPAAKAATLQYGDARNVLLDGKTLFDLESKRSVWVYEGGVHALGSTGALHRYIASDQIIGPGTLRTVDIPDKKAARAQAALADPKTPALLREGTKVSIQIVGEPGRDVEQFRRDLIDGLTTQFQAVGVTVADDQPVKVVARFTVKDTGRNIEYRKMGGPGGSEKRLIQARHLDWEFSVTDDRGSPVVIAKNSVAFSNPGFFDNIPNGENDWEGYLRARQYFWGAMTLLKNGVPFYVARRPDGGVFLPGRTVLGHPTL